MEAVLAGVKEHADRIGQPDLPVSVAITNLYPHRSQTCNYTHTRQWDVGLRLFMADLAVLTSAGSPFRRLSVMSHLDHIQHDVDEPLLAWDMGQVSSIMFDASTLPLEQNIRKTAQFVEDHGLEIVIEGACDEIVDAGGAQISELTTPEKAERYTAGTGVDFIVANLGTEHRASAADLCYHSGVARRIKERIGLKIVLHGCSSVPTDQLRGLFDDGICKVNIWTALERDASPALLAHMTANAAKVGGPDMARELAEHELLGSAADLTSKAHLDYFTTVYRQRIVFERMKRIVLDYLEMWYV